MKHGDRFCWAVRISWPLLGGVWGAWLGFAGYLRLPHNADSFAMPIAFWFFVSFALIGLIVGMASGALIGGLVENLFRRSGAGIGAALSVATLANALALWQIAFFVQANYPGLSAEVPVRQVRNNSLGVQPPAAGRATSATTKSPTQHPCADPPPAHPRERELWNSECR
jgi:hypothetical protein